MSNSEVTKPDNCTDCVQKTDGTVCVQENVPESILGFSDVTESTSTFSDIAPDHTYTMPSDAITTPPLHRSSSHRKKRMSKKGAKANTSERKGFTVNRNGGTPSLPLATRATDSQEVVVRGLEIGHKFQVSSRELPPGFSASDYRSLTSADTVHPQANGCLHNSFLGLSELLHILQDNSHSKCHSRIPRGVKNNVFFIIRSSEIVPNGNICQRRTIADDCGTWGKNAGVSKTSFVKSDSGRLEVVYLKDGKYGYRREIKGRLEISALEPQPDPSHVIKLCRFNAHLKSDQSYKKRVSWIESKSTERISVVEYLGKFPTIIGHGKREIDIVWTSSTTLQEISDRLEGKRKRDTLSETLKQQCSLAKKKRSLKSTIEAQVNYQVLSKQSTGGKKISSLDACPALTEIGDEPVDLPAHALANGILEGSFLNFNDLLPLLQTYDYSKCHQTIPSGIKNNVYFVVQNSSNSWKRSQKERSFFPDDCGTWNGSGAASPTTFFIKTETGEYKSALLKNDRYCYRRIVDGRTSYSVIQPQPNPVDVLKLCRYYTSLKVDPSYKKRVSWVDNGSIESLAVVEYLGKFPGIPVLKTITKEKPRQAKRKVPKQNNSTERHDASESQIGVENEHTRSSLVINPPQKVSELGTKTLPVWTLTDIKGSTEFAATLLSSVNDDFPVNETKRAKVNGHLKKSFLKLKDLMNILESCPYLESHPSIPLGIKDNVYFVVQNFANIWKRSCNERSSFPDDCGSWNWSSAGSPHTYIFKTDSGEYKSVRVKKGQFVFKTSVGGRTELLPLDPQPDPSQVTKLCRYYTTLKADSSYRKRVSWVETDSAKEECIAVVEYLGNYPREPTRGKPDGKPTKMCKELTSRTAEGIESSSSKRMCRESVSKKSSELNSNSMPVWTLEDCHMFTQHKPDVSVNDSTFPVNETVCAESSGVLQNSFLSLEVLIETLQNVSHSFIYTYIPLGSKNNVYFLVQESAKISKKYKQVPFIDDCGAWDVSSASCTKTHLMRSERGGYKTILLKNGVFVRRKETSGKIKYEELDPQPDPSQVLKLSRHYSCLKGVPSYKKRISWIESGSTNLVYVVEYLGRFPGLPVDHSHGVTRAKKDGVNEDTSDVDFDEIYELPDEGRIHDVEDRSKKKRRKDTEQLKLKHNIETHILDLEMSPAEVKTIVKKDKCTPFCIVIYSDDQIVDIKSICCTRKSVLTVEKTFKFGDMFVTSTCFKQIKVVKEKTGEFPIFIGPLLLHDNCDVKSYETLFNHIETCLTETEKSKLVLSCDKELSLVTALTNAFPEATQLQSAKNVSEGKTQSLGDEGDKKAIGEQIIDLDEVIQAVDSIIPDEDSVGCSTEINQRISSELVEMSWMNDKCRPLHQVLKQCVRWRSQPLESLTNTLSNLIRSQYKELRRALIGVGNYKLSETYNLFRISQSAWTSKSTVERNRYYQRFCSHIPGDQTRVSTKRSGKVTVERLSKLGKRNAPK